MIPQLTVTELKERLDRGDRLTLLDVREGFELEICKITPSLHIPMNQIPTRYSELNTKDEIVVICRSGQRSNNVANYLRQLGFEKVSNLRGGVLAWADEIDPSFSKY